VAHFEIINRLINHKTTIIRQSFFHKCNGTKREAGRAGMGRSSKKVLKSLKKVKTSKKKLTKVKKSLKS
jgi:hypothetical protein